MRKDVPDAAVKSAYRAFAIMELFDRERRPLAQKDVREALSLAPSSACALLKSLLHLGYLEFDRLSETYFPTMRIAALGKWVETGQQADPILHDLLRSLREETGMTIMLAVQSDLHAQYIHVLEEDALQFIAPPGTLRPLAGSGAGMMLLSLLDDCQIEKLWRRINASSTTRVQLRDVMQGVESARRNGYVFARNLAVEGGSVIALPFPSTDTPARPFALVIGGPTALLERDFDKLLMAGLTAIARASMVRSRFDPRPPCPVATSSPRWQ